MKKGYALQAPDGVRKAVAGFLKTCLDKDVFDAVLVCVRSGSACSYVLVQEPSFLDTADCLPPVMPVQGGKAVMSFTRHGKGMRIGALLRPCEIRAAVELSKLQQTVPENISFISMDCEGVIPLSDWLSDPEAAGAADGSGVRELCSICEQFSFCEDDPVGKADLHIATMGVAKDRALLVPVSARGDEILQKLDLTPGEETTGWVEEVEKLRKKRREAREESFAELRKRVCGLDALSEVFGRCLECHACRTACPICYCRVCFAGSEPAGDAAVDYVRRAERLGGSCCLPEQLLFHLGRMSHMSLSCVSCGMCEDVCPVDIPVGSIFSMVGQATQGLFDYVPGRSAEADLPLKKFVLDELEDVED